MLESHYFFNNDNYEFFGHGPFVAIGIIGEDSIEPLSTFGAGYMLGWKYDQESNVSWNVGLGYYVNTEATLMRDEYSDGMTTTVQDPEKLTYKKDVGALMLLFSATF
tara:strand:+ start:198 stop:518 length:321 start_codon:yes stop_codon:yes gene_type:complete